MARRKRRSKGRRGDRLRSAAPRRACCSILLEGFHRGSRGAVTQTLRNREQPGPWVWVVMWAPGARPAGRAGGREAGGLQAHKKKAFVPWPAQNAPGSVRGGGGALPGLARSPAGPCHPADGEARQRSAASSGQVAGVAGRDVEADPLACDPVPDEETRGRDTELT